MKVLITGGEGQLGKELRNFLENKNFEVISLGKKELDITNFEILSKVVSDINPEVMINCAAYTRVDDCENNIDKAFLVNSIGAKNVAIVSSKVNSKLFHISTDYVFDGNKTTPYTEYDLPNPISVYGKSKYYGEIYVTQHSSNFFILRVSGVYSKYGNNFVKTMINLSKERDKIKVVNDQFVTPTSAYEISKQIYELLDTENYGIYHATCEGSCSWYEFAKYLFELLNIKTKLIPITTEEFPRPARRPRYSVLENFNLKLIGYNVMAHWKEALKKFVESV